MEKLAVSQNGLVGIATGYADLTAQFRDRIKSLGRASIGAAIAALPAQLRAVRAVKMKHARDFEYAYDASSAYAIVGWSGEDTRCRAL
jgi:hypothetical protein